jgi:hypothetical protein
LSVKTCRSGIIAQEIGSPPLETCRLGIIAFKNRESSLSVETCTPGLIALENQMSRWWAGTCRRGPVALGNRESCLTIERRRPAIIALDNQESCLWVGTHGPGLDPFWESVPGSPGASPVFSQGGLWKWCRICNCRCASNGLSSLHQCGIRPCSCGGSVSHGNHW